MSVIVKGKPMPKTCFECFALDDNGDYPTCIITQTARGYTFRVREKRMPNCPLEEMPSTSCDNCKWEETRGYVGECHHCSRAYDDYYEVINGE